jgi:predicted exporter
VVGESEIANVLSTDLRSIFSGFLKLTLLAGVGLYAGIVLVRYLTDGPHLRPRFDPRDPARSAERLAVWLGVKALALAARVAAPIFGMLSEASAEVGEWFLGHRPPETH